MRLYDHSLSRVSRAWLEKVIVVNDMNMELELSASYIVALRNDVLFLKAWEGSIAGKHICIIYSVTCKSINRKHILLN